MERKNQVICNVSILFMATTIILGAAQPAFAQFTDFNFNTVHADWAGDPPTGWAPGPVPGPANFGADENVWPLFGGGTAPAPLLNCNGIDFCTLTLPNLEDNWPFKEMFIEITFQNTPTSTMVLPTVGGSCFNGGVPSPFTGSTQGPDAINPFSFVYSIQCEPNPDWEEIQIFFQTASQYQDILSLEIWTETYDDPPGTPVGGISIPIDQSALLLAGVQSVSMWMIPVVIAGIGIGIFVIKRRN